MEQLLPALALCRLPAIIALVQTGNYRLPIPIIDIFPGLTVIGNAVAPVWSVMPDAQESE